MIWPPPGWSTGNQTSALSPDSLTSYVCGIAGSLVGLGANPDDPEVRRAYLDLIGPFNAEADRADMARKSGYGLTVLGLLRCLGLDRTLGREAWVAYVSGRAFSDITQIGRRTKTKLPYDTEPQSADVVIVGTDPPAGTTPEQRAKILTDWGGPGHVMIVTERLADEVLSVDGGQKDPDGHQLITVKRRPLVRKGSQIWIGSRRVYSVIRLRDVGPHLTEPSCWPMI